jgi:aminoglycoside phosphotransferase (APT) family kinase protein
MIDVENASSYLVDHGLIDRSWIIEGSLVVRSIARRNRSLRVEGPAGTGLFLKQSDPSVSGGCETFEREVAFHLTCRNHPDFARFRQFVPRLVEFDGAEPVLILEWIAGAVGFPLLLESEDRRDFATEAAFALGSCLGLLHRSSCSILREQDGWTARLPSLPPWAMGLRRPGISWLAELSPATAEILRVLRTNETFATRFEPLSARWRAETLIHGDVRFDNVLIRTADSGSSGRLKLWLVDWEMVQVGDPAWDLAGALHDFLVHWISTMPLSADLAPAEWISGARLPLAVVRRATQALSTGYRETTGRGSAEALELISRAVVYSAARLIQTAFEGASTADRLPARSVVLLQLAANVLEEPERAQAQLYGIVPGGLRS